MQDPSRLGQRARDFLEEYRQVQTHLSLPMPNTRNQRSWSRPPQRYFKLNFDAAVFNDINASGVGAVIQNDLGEVMASLSARGPQVVDNEEAEVLACRKALEFAVESGFSELIIEGDNEFVMKSIAGSRPSLSRLGHLYADIQCIASGLHSVFITCVHRDANSVAHSLARHA
ncbi:uncharacterized protein LOC112011074 [Quercus suber]|uniref:uncharacterized protein LOC112011074 n=1 Tax=Quercus suber TaxID=58331 RepID=UPI000CE1A698|nr:uncharacterized protein LOC112011074 [Quercus suber]